MESGNPVAYGALNTSEWYQPLYDSISSQAGCNSSLDSLDCLRSVPYETLNGIINGTTTAANGAALTAFAPTVDGDFIARYTSLQLADGDFVKVPIISGGKFLPFPAMKLLFLTTTSANSDEGTAFSPTGVNTTVDFYNLVTHQTLVRLAPASLANDLLAAYPDDTSVNVVASLGSARPGAPFGTQYRRSASYYGDAVFIAARRLTCATWAAAGVPAYCYRFNAITANVSPEIAVTHFQEVAFVFYNTMGLGYPPQNLNPFEGRGQSYVDLARFMDSNWVSFVSDLDPNSWRDGGEKWNGTEAMWPRYEGGNPMNIVFDANVSSYAEADTYRLEGMRLINENNAGVYRR
jgi:Carboxylesterase family